MVQHFCRVGGKLRLCQDRSVPTLHSSIDFVAYDRQGQVILLAEAKTRRGTSAKWAAGLRTNMLSHGVLPTAKYFLIATPDHVYLWNQKSSNLSDAPPEFTIDGGEVFGSYFQKLDLDPSEIAPAAFELLVLTWLSDLARVSKQKPSRALEKARIEMTSLE
jgi:hypothetical protein